MSCKMELIKNVLEKVANSKGFGRCMKNIKLLSAGDGKCKAQFTVAEEHLNVGGFLHDLHVTFLKAAFPGETVTVDAKTIRSGKNLVFLAVELTKNDGKDIVARGQHTKYVGLSLTQ
ncbi:PREDICTED: uncharacterized protein LOC105148733 isoform X2 [Acromyrmex echinatior]|uniref:uncharacterized protein LOC105148733 isoform X2 n=1 Tax=Acromyrmex echinatior TaxID=103372 RepID=UPI000580BB53|nr:PREDICTED: uncharacterized protein LOC105148733 isoform X2 [Acromyrmex echinatior]